MKKTNLLCLRHMILPAEIHHALSEITNHSKEEGLRAVLHAHVGATQFANGGEVTYLYRKIG